MLAKVLENSAYIKGDGRFLLEIRRRMAILIFPQMIKAPVVGRGLHCLAEDLAKMVQRKAEKRHKSEPWRHGG